MKGVIAPCVAKLPGGSGRERMEPENTFEKCGLYAGCKAWMGF